MSNDGKRADEAQSAVTPDDDEDDGGVFSPSESLPWSIRQLSDKWQFKGILSSTLSMLNNSNVRVKIK